MSELDLKLGAPLALPVVPAKLAVPVFPFLSPFFPSAKLGVPVVPIVSPLFAGDAGCPCCSLLFACALPVVGNMSQSSAINCLINGE
jgi:hypothetical protein